MTGWGIGGCVKQQTAGPKSIHPDSGLLPVVPCHLVLILVSTPLRIVNRCCSGFLVSGGI